MKKLSKTSKEIEKILLIILFIIIPLYPKFPLINVPGTYVAIRIEDIIIASIFVYLIFRYIKRVKCFMDMPVMRSYTIYIVVGISSFLSALMITNTIQPLLGFLHLLRRLQYFTPFIVGYLAIKNGSIKKSFILKTLILVVFLVFFYGVGQKLLNWPIIVTQNREYAKGIALRSIPGGHLNSTFAGHYDMASYMILVIPIFIAYFAQNFSLKRLKTIDILSIIVVLVGTWLVGISGSRISTISFLGAGTLSIILVKKYKLIPFFIISAVLIFSLSSSLITRYRSLLEVGIKKVENVMNKLSLDAKKSLFVYAQENPQDFPEKRMKSEPTPTPIPVIEDRSTSIRLNIEWPRAIRAFMKNPILGTGYSSITLATDNDYLRLLGELGILGVLSFTSVFLVVGKVLIEGIKSVTKFNNIEVSFIVGSFSALFGIFVNAIFIDIFEASKFAITFWLMLGITIGIIDKKVNLNLNENRLS